jgi:YVTN family beta-propeller protein
MGPIMARILRAAAKSFAGALLAALILLAPGPAAAQTAISIGGGFNLPNGLAVDSSGNVFVADSGNLRVKKIPPGCTFSGCVVPLGGSVNVPAAIALDAAGNLFVANVGDGTVEELTAASNYATAVPIASGFSLLTGIAVDADGNVFVANLGTNHLSELLAASGYATQITLNLSFSSLTGVAVDAHGNLFTADENDGIQESPAAGGYASLINLASGSPNIVEPFGIGLDAAGNLYYTDVTLGAVFEISIASGYQTVVPRLANLNEPEGVAVDGLGNIYVAETDRPAVDELIAATTTGLTTSLTPTTFGIGVTFTATVTTSSGVATGSVTFMDGATQLGTIPLTAGTAAYATTLLPVGSHSITAAYGGDDNYAASTSSALTQVVDPAATTTALASSADPSVPGQSVTFTASVPGIGGTVTFMDGSTALDTVDLVAGTASYTSAALGQGNHSITAVYGGDADFAGSTSAALVQSVGLTSSATSLIASTNPSADGQPVSFTAFVSSSNGVPTGTVTFKDGATVLGAGALSSGIAGFATSGLTAATHSITAVYGGDSNFATSTSTAVSQVVNPIGVATTATILISSANPSTAGQLVSFTAVVSSSGGTPTGTVTFMDGVTAIGTGNLASGTASFATATLTTGSHSITAAYGGDGNFAVSTSAALTQIVNQASSTITLASSLNPTGIGQSVSFTASVSSSGGTPSGTVTFKDGAVTLGTVSLAAGTASFATAALTIGSHAITASYGGDATFGPSVSAALTQTVNQASSTITLASSANPIAVGQPVSFTARVSSSGGTPSGTVTFKDGAVTLGTGSLAAGTASLATAALTIGSHAITASYGGDTVFGAGVSAILTQIVGQSSTAGQAYGYQNTLGVTGHAAADNAHFSAPVPGAVDTAGGHLFVADTGNDRVQVIDTGTLAVVATIGVPGVSGADNAHLDQPGSVGFDAASGRILVADSGNQRLQLFDAKSFAYVATLGVTGVAGADNAHFNRPASASINAAAHQLYIADTGNHRVQIFDAGTLAYVATLGAAGVSGSDNAHFDQPGDAELDPSTNQILVADSGNARIQLFDAGSLAYAATLGGAGGNPEDDSHFALPRTAAFDPSTNLILVADAGANSRVQVFDAMTYGYVLTLGTTGASGPANTQFAGPQGVAIDPVHARMFVGDAGNDRVQIFAVAPLPLLASVLPGSRAVQLGHPATIFASVLNAGATALDDCRVALPVTAPGGLTLSYQTTDPATNALTGAADMPVTIPGGNGVQSLLITLQGTSPFSAPGLPLDFGCAGVAPAAVVIGVDTADLAMSSSPVADIIALAATPTNNGIVAVPDGGAAAFAVASINVGVTASLTVSVDTGNAALPVAATLCQSNPSTGQCLAPPAASVALSYAAGAVPTFSVFLQASGTIAFAPASSRVFVRFKDAGGGLHGSTSVAVETE